MICFDVFFFKQKTAYEMRISDWSSDVCSSDLSEPTPTRNCSRVRRRVSSKAFAVSRERRSCSESEAIVSQALAISAMRLMRAERCASSLAKYRSEEHTSELQSLMRISYAVFCLKKKKTTQANNQTRKTS